MAKKNKKPKLKRKKSVEPLCKNCLCYDHEKGICKVVVVINNNRFNLPVFPNDRCHMDELGIPVEQVRFWVEDENGKQTKGKGTVKIEYPDGFFAKPVDPEDIGGSVNRVIPDSPEEPPLK